MCKNEGANPGNRIRENRCVLKEHRIGKVGVDIRDTQLCGVPSERGFLFPGGFPGLAPWAGMQCPFRAWHRKRGGRLAPTEPRRHVGTRCPVVAWARDPKCHCSNCPNGATHTRQGIALGTANCPEGGNAYQPRVPTLGTASERIGVF